jgi:hypothetical protein
VTDETKPAGFMANIEQFSLPMTGSAVFPTISPGIPVRQTVPMMTTPASKSFASFGITF